MILDQFTAMLIGAAAIAVGLYVVGAIIYWFVGTYVRIFSHGVGEYWYDWNIVQKLLFLLGLCIWPMAFMLVFVFHIIGWIAVIYLAICAVRAISK